MLRIKSQQNFWAGVFFLACGVFEATLALQYDVGSPAAMGPGFMPVLLGIALILLGLIILVSGLSMAGPAIEPGHWRPIVCIIAALVLFALLINKAGLAVSTFLVVMLGGIAYRGKVPWLRLSAMALGMTIFAVVLFVYILGQPIAVWGSS
jgi:Tripartite tricarboxylate transporter TctB family